MRVFLLLLTLISSFHLYSQEGFPTNGVEDIRENHYALTNAKIHLDYKTTIENGILIIKNGLIDAVGSNINIPDGIRVFDLAGKHIYPSFIDLYSDYAIVKSERRSPSSDWMSSYTNPQMLSNKNGPFSWNESIRPEYNSVENIKLDDNRSKTLRNQGFGSVVTHNMDGIMRGTGAFISLASDVEQNIVLREKASSHFSFMKGSTRQRYPSSLMGAVALLKQSFFDAEWYKVNSGKLPQTNLSLSSMNDNKGLPKIIEVSDKLRVLLAQKIEKELGIKFLIKGGGDEYQRVNEIKQGNSDLIIPINYPKPFNVDDPFKNKDILLSQLKHWEMAPSNPYFLEKNDINFSITSHGIKNLSDFRKNLIKSHERGASKSILLKALTYNPSKFINMDHRIGSLKKSFVANFFISDGDIFSRETKILSNWVQGIWYRVSDSNINDYAGNYLLVFETNDNLKISNLILNVTGSKDNPNANILSSSKSDSLRIKTKIIIDDENINIVFNVPKGKSGITAGEYKLSGYFSNGRFLGKGTLNNFDWIDWVATKNDSPLIDINTNKRQNSKKDTGIGKVIYPFVEYGTET